MGIDHERLGGAGEGRPARLERSVPVLHVRDAAAAREFYRRLGFRVEFGFPSTEPGKGPAYLGMVRDGASLHLSSHAGDGVPGGVAWVGVDDVDALADELRRSGIPIHVGPVDQTWGMREVYILDLDGNSVRFAAPSAPAAGRDPASTST